MSRRTFRNRAPKSITTSTAAVQPALPFVPADLATVIANALAAHLAASQPAPVAAPVAPTPVVEPTVAPAAAIASVKRNWLALNGPSVVKRPFARVDAVRFDKRARRFRAATTLEARRAGGYPSYLGSAQAVIAADAGWARLAEFGITPREDGSVVIRNASAGVELRVSAARERLYFEARTLDNTVFADASRAARLAVTNLLNSLIA